MRYNPKKHRLPPFEPSGVLLVDKPAEWTSFDVVNFVRNRFNVPKVGHCGTLDPAATGLLVLVLGRFTKLSSKFSGEDKIYDGTILLGTVTDSQDMDGNILEENDFSEVTEEMLKDAMKSFTGDIEQIPPMVSAVKKNGKKLYELARKGEEIDRDPKEIHIESFSLNKFYLPKADFTVKCSKGTYVRTLCADIGEQLGCGASLFSLNRTKSGEFSLDNALSVDTLKTWEQEQLADHVIAFLQNNLMKNTKFTDF